MDNKGSVPEELQQENEILKYEKEQLELTIAEMSKNNALLEEQLGKQRVDLSKTHEQLKKESAIRVKQESVATTDKDKLIKSLQIQVSRFQQQLSVSCFIYSGTIYVLPTMCGSLVGITLSVFSSNQQVLVNCVISNEEILVSTECYIVVGITLCVFSSKLCSSKTKTNNMLVFRYVYYF